VLVLVLLQLPGVARENREIVVLFALEKLPRRSAAAAVVLRQVVFFLPSFLLQQQQQQQQQQQLVCVSLLECCSEAPTATENQNKKKLRRFLERASEMLSAGPQLEWRAPSPPGRLTY
jgi:hypothetical protein